MSKDLVSYNSNGLSEQKPEIVYETTRVIKNTDNDIEVHNFVFFTIRTAVVADNTADAVCRVANAFNLRHGGAFCLDVNCNNGRRCKWHIVVTGTKYAIQKFVAEASKLSSDLVYNYLEVGGKWIPVLSGDC
jgi:hypothetical protein